MNALDNEGASGKRATLKRKKGAAGLGFFIIILALTGFVTIVIAGVNLFFELTDDSDEKEAYAKKINPIVMLDPPNFNDPSELSFTLVLQTSIWTVAQDGLSRFNEDEMGRILIPFSDLQVACAKLYGGRAELLRESMTSDGSPISENSGEGVVFNYIPEADAFALPVMGEFGVYRAKVEKIRKKSGDIYLTVGYYPVSDSWIDQFSDKKSTDTADKMKIFVLRKNSGGGYYIHSLQNADIDAAI